MATNKTSINIPMPQVEVHLNGDWIKVDRLLQGMNVSVSKGYKSGVEICSKSIIRIVKTAVSRSQPPPGGGTYWAPLSPNTISSHGQHGIYNMTGLYGRSIDVRVYKNRTVIGLPMNVSVPDKNITLNQLSLILEFGDKDGRIPRRPLWGPSLKSFGGQKQIKVVIMREIRRKLMADFNLYPSQIRSTI